MKKLLVVLLVAVGCSPMPGGGDGGSGGGSAGGGSANAGGTAGGSTAGGSTAGGSTAGGSTAGGAAGPLRFGSLTVSQSTLDIGGTPFSSGLVMGNFFEIPSQFPPCSQTTIGACKVSDCAAAADAGTPPDGGQVGGGTLTVVGLADGGVTLAQGANGYFQAIQGAVLVPGQMITFSTSGGAVPALSATVTAPAAAVLTMPSCNQATCPAISRSTALSATWTGGSRDVFFELISGTSHAVCVFPASAGAGTIPTTVLSRLPAGTATLLFGTRDERSAQAGTWEVTASASDAKTYQTSLAP